MSPVVLGVSSPAPLHTFLSVAAGTKVGESLRLMEEEHAVAGSNTSGQYDEAGVLRQLCASDDAADF